MKRNFVIGLFGGLIGSAILLIVLSVAGIVGAQSADVPREEARLNTVSAATPLTSTFTYQGQLKNGGNAVNGSCQMAFRLYDDPTASTNLIGSPITTTVPVTSGLFTVGLNFGSNIFNGDGRWLDIQVNCTGTFVPLLPRQPLTAAPYAFALPGLYTQPNATSPNIIGGYSGNIVADGVVGGVIGGGGHSGFLNSVQANYATVGGGDDNTASGSHATVGGGGNNIASGASATIGGGGSNIAGDYATIGGGEGNTASGIGAFVGGGGFDGLLLVGNQAIGDLSTIGGGMNNIAMGNRATVPGGYSNWAAGDYSFAAGEMAQAHDTGAFVWADSTGTSFSSTGNNQFDIRANGGVKIVAGTNVFNSTSAALQVENATTFGEVAWLRLGSASNSVSVISLIKQAAGTGNFLQCYNESSGSFTSKCHIDSTGAFVGGSDFAESLGVVGDKSTYVPGDLIALSAAEVRTVAKAGGAYDPMLIGVYSTRPGFIGADKNGATEVGLNEIPVALTGIVPVKVTVENGAINIGDPLTSSSTPGVAMKATRAGKIVGYAMGIANANGTVLALVQPGYYLPSDQLSAQTDSTPSLNWFNLLSVVAFAGFAFMWLQQRRSKRGQS